MDAIFFDPPLMVSDYEFSFFSREGGWGVYPLLEGKKILQKNRGFSFSKRVGGTAVPRVGQAVK